MTYSFRLRFELSDRAMIDMPELIWQIEAVGKLPVRMRSVQEGQPIREATDLVLLGDGLGSAEEAEISARHWMDVLRIWFAALDVGADLGGRRPTSVITEAGKEHLSALAGGRPIMNDDYGVTVFESEPRPQVTGLRFEATKRTGEARTRELMTEASASATSLTVGQRLAFHLYSSSFFQPSADARLLLLMAAFEALIETQPRPLASVAHVERLIQLTEEADLGASEKASILGTLGYLKNESIRQGGLRLARTLEPCTYADRASAAFFEWAYGFRSGLTHGHATPPSWDEVNIASAGLELMVSHLLAGPLKDRVQADWLPGGESTEE